MPKAVKTKAELQTTSPPKQTKGTFGQEHKDILVRTVCRIILENRPAIYQAEGLEAFRSHGCEPANKQVLKLCREIVTMTGGDPAVINDLAKEVTAQRRAAKMDSSTASPQKRKHAAVKDEEGQTL